MSSLTIGATLRAGAVLRRWYVAIFVLVLMGIPILLAGEATGVYWSKVDVVFFPPGTAAGGNPLRSDSLGIVHYAAMIERQVDGQEDHPLLQTTGASLYGAGVRNGYSVYLPNAGGQWQPAFNRAAISVEVVGEDESEVRSILTGLVERIQAAATQHQTSMGVIPRSFITTSLSPETPKIHFQPAHPSYAVAALSLLAIGLAILAAVAADNIIAQRAARRRNRFKVGETPV